MKIFTSLVAEIKYGQAMTRTAEELQTEGMVALLIRRGLII